MIRVEQLTKQYAGVTAIDRLTFEVGKGEIVGFLGPNGAGKTTTMRILAGYMPATSGRACIGKYDVFRESLKARRCLGYLPENVPLYHEMRVSEYLRFRGSLKGLRGSALRRRIGTLAELCGLHEVERRVIGRLSKGYRQRVGLAEALIHEPDLLILDEPTIGLDPNQIRQVRELIKTLGERHTILLSTHILSEVEMTCSRVLIIHRGRIEASDSPANLVRQLRTSGVIRLEIHTAGEDPRATIANLPGVKEVAVTPEEDWLTCTVRTEANVDLRLQLFQLAADRHWQLRELTQDRATLEDVFVELTHTDA
ncbi:MAG: ATP-binding cassette domain-containing protein [Verrucomicrobia bacterium]|nr:ATP-binding cassette domain-containing protein [Verrucomicrobiota bacterium]